jgi:hypothetical protein
MTVASPQALALCLPVVRDAFAQQYRAFYEELVRDKEATGGRIIDRVRGKAAFPARIDPHLEASSPMGD